MPDLPLDLILGATGGRVVGGAPPAVFTGVSNDTRTLTSGQLYVALTGESFDGHEFVPQAFAKGAGAVLVSRDMGAYGPQIVVEDTLLALGAIAAAYRAGLNPNVLAITGSIGKTSTKEMLAAILEQGWCTHRARANFNNEIGLPLTLLELAPCHQAAVLEMAMRGRGQIAYLARLARPQIGIVTNVGVSHLELLGSRDAIAEAKAELVEALPANGRAVLNADDDYFHVLASRSAAPVLSFGTEEGADVRVSGIETGEQGRLTFRLSGQLIAADVAMPVTGRHHALNAAAAAAGALAAGASPEWVVSGLAGYGGGVMRGQVLPAPGGFTVLDDSYNAAPDSMRAALAMLADVPAARRWAVLGDMRELGDATIEQHHVLGHEVAATGIAGLVTVGELGRYIGEGAREAGLATVVETEDNAAAAAALLARVAPGDAVLVKGSRAMQMEAIVNALLGREAGGAHG